MDPFEQDNEEDEDVFWQIDKMVEAHQKTTRQQNMGSGGSTTIPLQPISSNHAVGNIPPMVTQQPHHGSMSTSAIVQAYTMDQLQQQLQQAVQERSLAETELSEMRQRLASLTAQLQSKEQELAVVAQRTNAVQVGVAAPHPHQPTAVAVGGPPAGTQHPSRPSPRTPPAAAHASQPTATALGAVQPLEQQPWGVAWHAPRERAQRDSSSITSVVSPAESGLLGSLWSLCGPSLLLLLGVPRAPPHDAGSDGDEDGVQGPTTLLQVLELIVKSHADTTASQYPPTIHTDVTRVVHQWVAARPPPPHAACALLEVLVQHAEVLVQHITNTGSDQRNSSSSRESSSNSSRVVELLCAVLHVMETLVHLDDACRAAAVGLPAVNAADSAPTHQYISINTPHIHTSSSSPAPPPPPLPTLDPCCVSLVLQLLQQHATASSYLVHAALGVLHALLGAARDRGCTSLCARVLEADALREILHPDGPYRSQALHTLHALLEGCAPPAAADMGLVTGAATFGLLRQVVQMLDWPAHTPTTAVQQGAHDAPRQALALLAMLLEQQQTALLAKLLDGPTQGDTPGPVQDSPGCCLAQALVGLADGCTRNPTAGALQGVVAWPYPTNVLHTLCTSSGPTSPGQASHGAAAVWVGAPLATQRRYWLESVRLCLETLVLLRALLTNTGTGLAALEDLLATSGAARHALLTTARLQAWAGVAVSGGAGVAAERALPLAAWIFRVDSVERNPLLQRVRYADVHAVSQLASSVRRRVLPSIEDGGGGMEIG